MLVDFSQAKRMEIRGRSKVNALHTIWFGRHDLHTASGMVVAKSVKIQEGVAQLHAAWQKAVGTFWACLNLRNAMVGSQLRSCRQSLVPL
jgi:hypothetical protein